MNFLHMKYAVEIADSKSINKAAEKLFVAQSNLSRAVKELETSLGTAVFERSARGMILTPEGEIFIKNARSLLKQIDKMENMFSDSKTAIKRFSVSVPCASYIADAFVKFSCSIEKNDHADIYYRETDAMTTIKNVSQDICRLGIIRYPDSFIPYYKTLLEEKKMDYEIISEFSPSLLMSRESPLASLETITSEDVKEYIEITQYGSDLPSFAASEAKKEKKPYIPDKRITVFERGSQFELLSENPQTVMWVSHIPEHILDRYGLTEKKCPENKKVYRDVLIHKGDYTLSETDKLFIGQLIETKRKLFG